MDLSTQEASKRITLMDKANLNGQWDIFMRANGKRAKWMVLVLSHILTGGFILEPLNEISIYRINASLTQLTMRRDKRKLRRFLKKE